MMEIPHKKRKVRKQRGSRTHGYGRVGQHRSGGSRGGRGKAGYLKHKWSYVVNSEPNYFGKHGFKSPRRDEVRIINIGVLGTKISQLLKEKKVERKEEGVYVDLDQLGYDKLLGSGQLSQPLIVRVSSHSKIAEEKVKKANGKIIMV